MSETVPSRASSLRLFSSAIADQALLSLANFIAGVLMLRRVSDADYGLYVLVTSALLLVTGMQIALISCPMAVMAAKKEASDRLGMAVDLLRRQYVVWLPSVPVSLLVCGTFCWQGHSYAGTAGIIVTCVALLTVAREHLRQMLLLYTMPGLLLTTDAVYAVVLLGGTYAATRSAPAGPLGAPWCWYGHATFHVDFHELIPGGGWLEGAQLQGCLARSLAPRQMGARGECTYVGALAGILLLTRGP